MMCFLLLPLLPITCVLQETSSGRVSDSASDARVSEADQQQRVASPSKSPASGREASAAAAKGGAGAAEEDEDAAVSCCAFAFVMTARNGAHSGCPPRQVLAGGVPFADSDAPLVLLLLLVSLTPTGPPCQLKWCGSRLHSPVQQLPAAGRHRCV